MAVLGNSGLHEGGEDTAETAILLLCLWEWSVALEDGDAERESRHDVTIVVRFMKCMVCEECVQDDMEGYVEFD